MNQEKARRHARWRLPSGVYNPVVAADGRRWRDYEQAAEAPAPSLEDRRLEARIAALAVDALAVPVIPAARNGESAAYAPGTAAARVPARPDAGPGTAVEAGETGARDVGTQDAEAGDAGTDVLGAGTSEADTSGAGTSGAGTSGADAFEAGTSEASAFGAGTFEADAIGADDGDGGREEAAAGGTATTDGPPSSEPEPQVESARRTEPGRPVEFTDAVEPDRLFEPVRVARSADSVEPGRMTGSVRSAEPAQRAEPGQRAEPADLAAEDLAENPEGRTLTDTQDQSDAPGRADTRDRADEPGPAEAPGRAAAADPALPADPAPPGTPDSPDTAALAEMASPLADAAAPLDGMASGSGTADGVAEEDAETSGRTGEHAPGVGEASGGAVGLASAAGGCEPLCEAAAGGCEPPREATPDQVWGRFVPRASWDECPQEAAADRAQRPRETPRAGADDGPEPEEIGDPDDFWSAVLRDDSERDWLDGPGRPRRLEATRPYGRPGGLAEADPGGQESLAQAVSGRFPDPRGTWIRLINAEGPTEDAFRSNNAVDCALSVMSTWHGEPVVAARRQPEYDPSGRPLLTGETGGVARAEEWLGHRFEYVGHGRRAYVAIAQRLIFGGHGAAAVLITRWAGGGSHAWNAVNCRGEVLWIDAQRGHMAVEPPYEDVTGVFAVVIDRQGRRL